MRAVMIDRAMGKCACGQWFLHTFHSKGGSQRPSGGGWGVGSETASSLMVHCAWQSQHTLGTWTMSGCSPLRSSLLANGQAPARGPIGLSLWVTTEVPQPRLELPLLQPDI